MSNDIYIIMKYLDFFVWRHVSYYLSHVPPFNRSMLTISTTKRDNASRIIQRNLKRKQMSSTQLHKHVSELFNARIVPSKPVVLQMFIHSYLTNDSWNNLPDRMCANCFSRRTISWTHVEKLPKPGQRTKYSVYRFLLSLDSEQMDVITRDYLSTNPVQWWREGRYIDENTNSSTTGLL